MRIGALPGRLTLPALGAQGVEQGRSDDTTILYPLGPPREEPGARYFGGNQVDMTARSMLDHPAPSLSEAGAPRLETAAFTMLRAS